MTRRIAKRITLLAGVAGSLVLLLSTTIFRDTFVEYWSIMKLSSSSREGRNAAAQRLARLKSVRAVPALLEAEMVERRAQAKAPGSESVAADSSSVFLEAIFETGERAVPPLTRKYKQASSQEREIIQLLVDRLLPEASSVEMLLDILEDAELQPFHASAADALGGLSEAASTAVPRLLRLLENRKGSKRLLVMTALRMILSMPELTIPALVSLLDDGDSRIRSEAAFTLGLFGEWARGTEAGLEKLLKDEDPAVVNSASWALDRVAASHNPSCLHVKGKP